MLRAALTSCLIATAAQADDKVSGHETLFTSPNGVTERCVRIAPMPGAEYSEDDLKAEEAFCAIDLYGPTIALCPKTWRPAPG